jgi:transposase
MSHGAREEPAPCRAWRAMLTPRRMVLNKRRDVENDIRALLREVGLKVGTPSRKDFPARVRELAADDPVLISLAESLLTVIEVMTREVERLTKRALDEVRVEPTCRRLMTVPGVGPLTVLAFRATIDQPGRFRKSRDAGAHRGLMPRRYQSGETDVQGRISRCGGEAGPYRTLRSSPLAAYQQRQMVGVARRSGNLNELLRKLVSPGFALRRRGGRPAFCWCPVVRRRIS